MPIGAIGARLAGANVAGGPESPSKQAAAGQSVNQPAFRCSTCADKPRHDEKQVRRRSVSTFLRFAIKSRGRMNAPCRRSIRPEDAVKWALARRTFLSPK